MPNWCNNRLSVAGDLTKFNAALAGKSFSINAFIPTPAELVETVSPNPDPKSEASLALVKKFGHDNWYDWNVANWGTKWDVEAETIEQTEGHAVFSFDSAWAPPTAAIVAVSALYPDLKFTLEYFEMGMMFAGVALIENGEVEDNCTEDEESDLWEQVAVGTFGYEPYEEDSE